MERVILWNIPEQDFSIFGATDNLVLVERVESSVQHCGLMAPEQRDGVRSFPNLRKGNNSESATSGSLPIYRKILTIGVDNVGVPSILGDLQVFVAQFFFGWLAKYVSVLGRPDKLPTISVLVQVYAQCATRTLHTSWPMYDVKFGNRKCQIVDTSRKECS